MWVLGIFKSLLTLCILLVGANKTETTTKIKKKNTKGEGFLYMALKNLKPLKKKIKIKTYNKTNNRRFISLFVL